MGGKATLPDTACQREEERLGEAASLLPRKQLAAWLLRKCCKGCFLLLWKAQCCFVGVTSVCSLAHSLQTHPIINSLLIESAPLALPHVPQPHCPSPAALPSDHAITTTGCTQPPLSCCCLTCCRFTALDDLPAISRRSHSSCRERLRLRPGLMPLPLVWLG